MRRTDWHPADIKAALSKKGYTFARIAREEGLYPTTPNAVLFRTFRRMERRVAALLGVKPETIWPSRYGADGSPLPRVRKVS